jgi:hypothetical protein
VFVEIDRAIQNMHDSKAGAVMFIKLAYLADCQR